MKTNKVGSQVHYLQDLVVVGAWMDDIRGNVDHEAQAGKAASAG